MFGKSIGIGKYKKRGVGFTRKVSSKRKKKIRREELVKRIKNLI